MFFTQIYSFGRGDLMLCTDQDGKDIKTTKQKTKHQRCTVDPLFEERLIVYLPADTVFDDRTRLQVRSRLFFSLSLHHCFFPLLRLFLYYMITSVSHYTSLTRCL